MAPEKFLLLGSYPLATRHWPTMDSPFDNTFNSMRLALEWRFRSLEAIHLHYITNTITKKEIDLTLFYVCLFTGFYSFIFVA